MKSYKIAAIPHIGVGQEVIAAGVEVIPPDVTAASSSRSISALLPWRREHCYRPQMATIRVDPGKME